MSFETEHRTQMDVMESSVNQSQMNSNHVGFQSDEFAITVEERMGNGDCSSDWSLSNDDIELTVDTKDTGLEQIECVDVDCSNPVSINVQSPVLGTNIDSASDVVVEFQDQDPKAPKEAFAAIKRILNDTLERAKIEGQDVASFIGLTPRENIRYDKAMPKTEIESLQSTTSCVEAVRVRTKPFQISNVDVSDDDLTRCTTWDAIELSTCDIISEELNGISDEELEFPKLIPNSNTNAAAVCMTERMCRFWIDTIWDSRDTNIWREAANELMYSWFPLCC